MSHPQAVKMLSPGRVVIIDTHKHKNMLGLMLQMSQASAKERSFTVLTLCEQQQTNKINEPHNPAVNQSLDTDGSAVQPFTAQYLYRPEGPCPGCEMVKIRSSDISVITTKTLKIIPDRIIDDIRKRQQPRFRLVVILSLNYIYILKVTWNMAGIVLLLFIIDVVRYF